MKENVEFEYRCNSCAKHFSATVREKGNPPPKGTVFLARIKGYPWFSQCVWNSASGTYTYSVIGVEKTEDGEEHYFENEYCKESDILEWKEA